MNLRGGLMKKLLISLLALFVLMSLSSCDNSTPTVPDDAIATRIIEDYSNFISFIYDKRDDNRLDVSGSFDPAGSATVNTDIVNGDYTYKKGSYASLNINGDVEISMDYIKDTVPNTLYFEGYSDGGSPIPEKVIYNDVEYDLYSWMASHNY